MTSQILTVGQVAKRCNITADTVRYYEERNLIPEPPRSKSGYRNYPPETIKRVAFIRRAKELGFSLEEIGGLLDLRADDTASCDQVRQVAQQKATEVRQKITDLQEILDGLEALSEICPSEMPISDCPILEMLSESM